jgi:thiamine-phosphate pyrophosphorylase
MSTPDLETRRARLHSARLYLVTGATAPHHDVAELVRDAAAGGVDVVQLRDKLLADDELVSVAHALRALCVRLDVLFIVNDRPGVALESGADGVHVGQDDLEVEQARQVIGPDRWVGVSTHNLEQFQKAVASSADYIAVGPIFQTSSKVNPDPVVGTELLRRVRALTLKPIVAIGGITLERAGDVLAAGADSVAVISDILKAQNPAGMAREFIRRLDAAKPAASH